MTKRNDIISIFILLAAALLVGCSHSNAPTEPLTDIPQDILVRTNVGGFLKGNRIQSIDNNTALRAQDILINAYFHGTDTKYLDGTKLHYDAEHDPSPAWVFWNGTAQVHYYWPFEGAVYNPSSDNIAVTSLDFVGFCPFDAPSYVSSTDYDHTTGASFTCDLSSYMTPASQTSMPEYLMAVLPAQTITHQAAAGGALPMTFKHPLAQVKFVIADASGTHVTVNSISIADLHTGGTCTFDGTDMTWSSLSGSADMALTGLDLTVGGTTETLPFIVIPFSGTKTLTVNASWDDWSEVDNKDINTEVTFDWQPGYIYTHTLTVTKYALKVDITRYTEQW